MAIDATSAWEPSPPAIPRQSAPRATASRAICARSRPGSKKTTSTPSSAASSGRPNLSTLPPPDFRLQISTGCVGCTRLARIRSMSCRLRTSAPRAVEIATASKTSRIRSRQSAPSLLALAHQNDAITSKAPITSKAIPKARRGFCSVISHQPPVPATARPTKVPTSKMGCFNRKITASRTVKVMAISEITASTRFMVDGGPATARVTSEGVTSGTSSLVGHVYRQSHGAVLPLSGGSASVNLSIHQGGPYVTPQAKTAGRSLPPTRALSMASPW